MTKQQWRTCEIRRLHRHGYNARWARFLAMNAWQHMVENRAYANWKISQGYDS